MSPRRKKLLPKSRTALEYQNRSHDNQGVKPFYYFVKTDLLHD